MSNLFDSTNFRSVEPNLEVYGFPIVAGDFLAWKRTDLGVDYPPSAYGLTYSARLNGVGTAITLTASESGTEYIIEENSTATVNFPVGIYQWSAFITKTSDSNRIQVGNGTWEVVENKAVSTADPEPYEKKVLDAIQAVIQGRATQDQMSYSIAGRSLSRMDPDDLHKWEALYKAKWLKLKRMQRARAGMGHDGNIKTRLGRY